MSLLLNSGISNDLLARSFQNRMTIPLGSVRSPPMREGSMIFDSRLNKLYISDGTQWLQVIISPGGNIVCIQDDDGDTSVCTDTVPGTDSDTIVFTTSGVERARITPAGVLSVGNAVPAAGKIAHFEGDIKVTGVVDPTATQYEEEAISPVDPNGTTTGVVWVRNDGPPNILVFTNNSGVNIDLTGSGAVEDLALTLVAGNTTGGTDIELTTGDELVGQTDITLRSANDINLITAAGRDVNITGNLNVTGTTTTINTH